MGKQVFKLPDIGEGVVEGEVVQWHVAAGDAVTEDDPIVDVMTDKATVTIPSPVTGVVTSLSGDVGDMVAVGSTLVEFDSDADAAPASEPEAESEAESFPTPPPAPEPAAEPTPAPAAAKPAPAPAAESSRVLASPAIRRRAREAGVDLGQVRGSGPAGRTVSYTHLRAHET